MYSIVKQGDSVQSYVNQVIADNADDVQKLPKSYAPGSSCFVIEDCSRWVLGVDNTWHKLPSSNCGNADFLFDFMDNHDVDAMFEEE